MARNSGAPIRLYAVRRPCIWRRRSIKRSAEQSAVYRLHPTTAPVSVRAAGSFLLLAFLGFLQQRIKIDWLQK